MTQAHRRTRHGGRAPGRSPSDGFTLMELITVLMIIGILSAVIVSSVGTMNSDLTARKSELRSQLRYLQLMAMKNSTTYLTLQSDGTSYWASNNATTATAPHLLLPGESSATVSLADKKMTLNSFVISFDAYGIPYSGNPPAKLAANATITLTINAQTDTLTVAPETGFVP